ncbi:MAG: transcriptional regulator FtsR [Oryzihumus sp.]
MTIGAVLAALQEEFPDVSISKIRYLEAEGLVTPERTGAGYRTFSEADVGRLRYILRAQRDRFWPLKVIREALDAMDRGLEPPSGTDGPPTPRVPVVAGDPAVPDAAELSLPGTLRLTARELREAAGLDLRTFEALETFGLVRPDRSGHFGEPDLAVARAAGALAGFGIEARHLRPFRTAADREIGLVQQVVSPMRGRGKTRQANGSADPTAEILSQCIALHAALVRSGLRTD